MRAAEAARVLALASVLAGCGRESPSGPVLTISASAVGREGDLLRRQLRRFEAAHPGVRVVARQTPDAADQRHQLYVQWLAAGVGDPDVLQIDVIWTAELAAAGWIRPVPRGRPALDAFFPRTVEANTWRGRAWAVPWFCDVGMLYYRTDLVPHAPATFDELETMARRARERGLVRHGLLWQGARYEGLVTTFLEHLGGFGGRILDRDGQVLVDRPAAVRALSFMRRSVRETGIVPEAALSWQEEETRLAFQNGHAAFLRSWPYAWPLLNDRALSKVAGKVGVAPMPAAEGGRPTSALGGAQLAVNAHSDHPDLAWALVEYLTGAERMLERARVVGQYPSRPALYEGEALHEALGLLPSDVRRIVEAAVPRPPTPVYTELSQRLQVRLHRALTGQQAPERALRDAAREMRAVLRAAGLAAGAPRPAPRAGGTTLVVLGAVALLAAFLLLRRRRAHAAAPGTATIDPAEERLGWSLVSPALVVIALVALFPLASAVWESLHDHDLRAPWRGSVFVGLDNYAEAFADPRFGGALVHTGIFAAGTVILELLFGLALAMGLDAPFRGRGVVRATVLLPWAIPTVVAALVFRFCFDADGGIANAVLTSSGLSRGPIAWLGHATLAWVPVIAADVWKTTPFVTILLLAGLQGIDPSLYEAARVDGAGALARFWHITLPQLRPALLVALLFRTLDAVRVFDLVYVLTGGGPGTATEPLALYTFASLLQDLRFGYGSALSVLVFAVTAVLALAYVRLLGSQAT